MEACCDCKLFSNLQLSNSTILPTMAVCNTSIAQLHSNTLLLLHIFMVSFFLSLKIPFANSSLSFSFNNFDLNGHQIHFEGQTSYSGYKSIHLTRNQRDKMMNDSWRRATYREPFHLWNKALKRLVDFSTNLSFGIDSQIKFSYGDGLAFFLAPNGTQLPSDVTGGSDLGLLSNNQQALNSTGNHFFCSGVWYFSKCLGSKTWSCWYQY